MAIDPKKESLITLIDGAKLIPSSPKPSALWRWADTGCRGVYLDTIIVGWRRMTSREAIARFMAAQTRAASPEARRARRARKAVAHAGC